MVVISHGQSRAAQARRQAAVDNSTADFEFIQVMVPNDRLRTTTEASIPISVFSLFSSTIQAKVNAGALQDPWIYITEPSSFPCDVICKWMKTEWIRGGHVQPLSLNRLFPDEAMATIQWARELDIRDELLQWPASVRNFMYVHQTEPVLELWQRAKKQNVQSIQTVIEQEWQPYVMRHATRGSLVALLAAWPAATRWENQSALDGIRTALESYIDHITRFTPSDAQRIIVATSDSTLEERALGKAAEKLIEEFGLWALNHGRCWGLLRGARPDLRKRIEAKIRARAVPGAAAAGGS